MIYRGLKGKGKGKARKGEGRQEEKERRKRGGDRKERERESETTEEDDKWEGICRRREGEKPGRRGRKNGESAGLLLSPHSPFLSCFFSYGEERKRAEEDSKRKEIQRDKGRRRN